MGAVEENSNAYRNVAKSSNTKNSAQDEFSTLLDDLGEGDNDSDVVTPEPQAPSIQDLLQEDAKTQLPTEETVGEPVKQLVGGVAESFQEIGNSVIDASNAVDDWLAEQGIGSGDFIEGEGDLNFADNLFPPSNDANGRLAREIGKLMIPLGVGGAVAKGYKGVAGLKAIATSAAIDFAAFDPHQERLSDVIEDNAGTGLIKQAASMLASNEDDSAIEGRFKNAVEGLLFGGVIVGGARGASKLTEGFTSYMKASRRLEKLRVGEVDVPGGGDKKISLYVDLPEKSVTVDKQALAGKENVTISDIEDITRVNLLKYSEEQDVLETIRVVARENKDIINKARRGKIAQDETLEQGKKIVADAEQLKRILARESGQLLNAEETVAANIVLSSAAKDAARLAKKAVKGTLEDKAAFREGLENLLMLERTAFGSAAEIGRAQNAQRILVGEVGELTRAKYLTQLVKKSGGEANLDDMASKIAQVADLDPSNFVENVKRISLKSKRQKLADAVFEVYINSLVSSFKTQLVNLVSGTVTGVNTVLERAIARQFTKVRQARGDEAPGIAAGELHVLKNTMLLQTGAQARSALFGFTEGVQMAAKQLRDKEFIAEYIKAGKKIPKTLSGYSIDAKELTPAISSEAFGATGTWGDVVDVFGSLIRTPTRNLMRGDEIVGAIHYRSQLHSLAWRDSVDKALEGDKFLANYNRIINGDIKDIPDVNVREHIQGIRNRARAATEQSKFTAELDGLPGVIQKVIKGGGPESAAIPGLRFLIPFSRVDLNIIDYTLDRFPGVTNFLPKYRRAIEAGGAEADIARAKIALGGAYMALGATLAGAGFVTGNGPANVEARKLKQAGGWQPNSIRIGDTYLRHDRAADPFSKFLSLGADFAEIVGQMQDNPSDQFALGLAGAAAIGEAMTPELLTQNMADVLSLLRADAREAKTKKILSGLAAGVIPFSAMLRDIRKGDLPFPGVIEDRFQRDVSGDPNGNFAALEEMVNRIKAQLPGMSSTLPPRRTMFGEPITYPEGWGPDMASPIAFTRKKDSPIIDEMIRLGVTGPLLNPAAPEGESHLVLRMPSRVVTKSFGSSRVAVKLTPQQYDKLVQLSAGIGLGKNFPKLEDKLNETLKGGSYKKASDEKRRLIILQIVSAYRELAKAKLAQEDTSIPEQMIQLGEQKRDAVQIPRPSDAPSL